MSTMKAIPDEQLAKFVDDKVKEIDEHLLQVGAGVQRAVRSMERALLVQSELKEALRTGHFQMLLPLR